MYLHKFSSENTPQMECIITLTPAINDSQTDQQVNFGHFTFLRQINQNHFKKTPTPGQKPLFWLSIGKNLTFKFFFLQNYFRL